MTVINRFITASEICGALGLDPREIHTLKIILDDGLPRVEIVMPLFATQGGLLSKTLAEYVLVKKSDL